MTLWEEMSRKRVESRRGNTGWKKEVEQNRAERKGERYGRVEEEIGNEGVRAAERGKSRLWKGNKNFAYYLPVKDKRRQLFRQWS